MKALVTALSFLFSTSAFAAIDFSHGQRIDQVKVDGKPSQFSASVTIQTAKVGEKITVHMMAPFDCPTARFCPAVMTEVELSAEIVSIGDDCGSVVYTALTDHTPHDGLKTQITVQDNSTRMCRDMRPGVIEVNATTEAVRTRTVKNYEAVQTWKLNHDNYDLSQGVNMKSVKLSGGETSGRAGFVKIDESSREVTVSYLYAQNKSEVGIHPTKLQHKTLKLTLMSKKDDGCGSTIYTAQTAGIKPGASYTEVTIADNTNRICEDVYRARLVLDGTIRFPYPGRKQVNIEMLK